MSIVKPILLALYFGVLVLHLVTPDDNIAQRIFRKRKIQEHFRLELVKGSVLTTTIVV